MLRRVALVAVFCSLCIYGETAANLLHQAQTQFERQHWSEAAKLAHAALNADHTLADAHTLLGLIAVEQGRLNDAEGEFRAAVASQPRNYRLLGYLGGIYMQQRRFAEAEAMFGKALRLNPDDLAAHYNLGLALLATSNAAGAAAEFGFVARRSPTDIPARIGLLESRLRLKDQPAATSLTAELDGMLGPATPERARIAALLASSGRDDLAIPLLEKMLRHGPAGWDSVYNLVLLYQRAGRYDEAATLLQRFPEGPHAAEARNLLGSVEGSRGRRAESLLAYRSAVSLEPANESYRFDYCNALLQYGDLSAAEQSFREAVQAAPSSWKLRAGLGVSQFILGKFQDSAETLLAAVHLNPVAPVVYELLDRVYDADPGSRASIRAAFAAYVATNPPGSGAYAAYGRMLFDDRADGAGAAAVRMLLKAIRLDPSCAEAYAELAVIAQAEGRADEAIGWYEKAVRADTRNAQVHYRLALAYQRAGLVEKADREMAAFRKLKSEDPQQEAREAVQKLR